MMPPSSLFALQCILIGLGLLFQIVAFSSIKREIYGHRYRTPDTDDDESETPASEKVALPTPTRTKAGGRKSEPKPVHDFYEMEKTPANVKPAELMRTAKVKYFDDYKARE